VRQQIWGEVAVIIPSFPQILSEFNSEKYENRPHRMPFFGVPLYLCQKLWRRTTKFNLVTLLGRGLFSGVSQARPKGAIPLFAPHFLGFSSIYMKRWRSCRECKTTLHVSSAMLVGVMPTQPTYRYCSVTLLPVHKRVMFKEASMCYRSCRLVQSAYLPLAVASPASGHVGTCPPPGVWENFFR